MSVYKRLREFVEGEDAKADDIEVEFDNIANILQGKLGSENIAPGSLTQAVFSEAGRIRMGSFSQSVGSPTVGAPAAEFLLTGYSPLSVPAASTLLIIGGGNMQATADFGGPVDKISGRVTPRLDNVPLPVYSEVANQSPQVTDGSGKSSGVGATIVQGGSAFTEVLAVGPGAHTLALCGSTAYTGSNGSPTVTFWTSYLSWILLPN